MLVIVPGGNAPSGSERDLLSRDSFDQYARAVHADGMPTIFDLRAFDGPVFGTFNIGPLASRVSCPEPRTEVRAAQDVEIASLCGPPPRPGPVPADPLEPSSPAQIALGTVLVLAALSIVGFGWARATRLYITAAATLSPAFGLAAFTLTAVALERAGVPLTGSLGPSIVSALAGAGGYVAWNVAERRTVEDPAPEVDER